jgi:CRP-like cAMP-binding protein
MIIINLRENMICIILFHRISPVLYLRNQPTSMKTPKKIEAHSCLECSSRGDSVLCSMQDPDLSILSDSKSFTAYRKGQPIFTEGSHPYGLFCIYSGKVKVHKLGDDGKEQIVRFAKPGDVLGYRALMSGDNYNATATALEETYACCFPKNVYFEMLKSDPSLSFSIIKQLASDLRSAEKMIIGMAQKQVRERIADALLMLSNYYGVSASDSTINAVLTREELSDIAGTSTETTIRVLSDLKKEKCISFIGKRIKILDQQALLQSANPLI